MADRQAFLVTYVRLLIAIAASLLPGGLTAQAIVGRALDDATGAPLSTVAIRLLAQDGALQQSTVSDTAGVFRLRAPLPGRYLLEGVLVGYGTVRSARLDLAQNREITVELRLSQNAIPLDPIRVIAERAIGTGRLADYYRRAEWAKKTGFGTVYTRADIDRLRYPFAHSYAPRARSQGASQYVSEPRIGCIAETYLDNMRVPLSEIDAMNAENLEGVEVYVGMHVPFEYQMGGPCAVVLFWTRPESRASGRLTLGRAAAGLVALALVVLVSR